MGFYRNTVFPWVPCGPKYVHNASHLSHMPDFTVQLRIKAKYVGNDHNITTLMNALSLLQILNAKRQFFILVEHRQFF